MRNCVAILSGTLLTFLSYVGEYPLCSLQLFGSKEVWRKLIHKHSQRQEYRIPGHADKITCRLLLITGKGKSKSVRLSKGGQNILEIVNPNAALYYTQNYLRHNHAGEAKRLDRFHRVAESAALISLAGFETCPYRLPQLQMVTIRKIVTDAPSFYISNLAYVYQLLTHNSEKTLTIMFEKLPPDHPARAPFNLFSQSSDTVKSGIFRSGGSVLSKSV